MIHHLHFIQWKVAAVSTWGVSFTAFAVTEAFLGQMLIALVVALIGAAPPTVAIILMARKQSFERSEAQKLLLAGQAKMHTDLDGKLEELTKAKEAVSHAAGKEQERTEERARVETQPAKVAAPTFPTEIKITNKKNEPVPTIPIEET